MIYLAFLFFFLPAVFVQAASHDLDANSFKENIGKHKTMVVAFVAPWCSKCKELTPQWDEMAKNMDNSQDGEIFLGKVDCVEHPDLYYSENIVFFPTIKSYVNYNAIPIVYDGEIVANTMWRYFRQMHEQYVNEIFTVEEFKEIQGYKLNRERPLVVAMLSADDTLDENSPMNRKIDGACKMADRVRCYLVRNPSFGEELGLSTNSLTMFTMFDEQQVDYSLRLEGLEDISGLDMAEWIKKNAYPPVVELTPENDKMIFSGLRPGFENHILFMIKDAKSIEGQEIIENLKVAAMDSIGNCVFIYVDLSSMSLYSSSILQSLKVDPNLVETAVAHAVTSKKPDIRFYKGLEGQVNDVEAVTQWVRGVLGRTIEPVNEIHYEE